MQSLKTTAGAMVLSAAFLAFRPIMPPPSEAATAQPAQVTREDAADGARESQPCPRKWEGVVESVADEAGRPKCGVKVSPGTEMVAAPVADRSSM